MNKPRRKPSEAIDAEPAINDFITDGVRSEPNPKQEVASGPEQVAKIAAVPDTRESHDASPSEPERKSRAKRRPSKSKAQPNSNQWNQAMFAKATIQKTVRFKPQLIARWEQLAQATREIGGNPASFQQVQNEALRFWLESQDLKVLH